MNLHYNTKKSLIALSLLIGAFAIIFILEQFDFFHFPIFSNDLSVSREEKIPSRAVLITKDQPAGSSITIESASLTTPGFVVVHTGSLPTDRGMAATNLLQPGSYSNFSLTTIRKVKAGEVFTVMIHKDNGDRIFHLEEDLPVRNSAGSILSSKISIF